MDPFSAAIEVVPLAGEQLKKFLSHNEVKNLYGLVMAEVRQAPLPPGTVDQVVAKIDELRVDPAVAGALLTLLERGESRVKDPLRRRLVELLSFEDPRLDSNELADLVLRAIEANLARAKHNARSAQHLDALITQDALRALPDQVARAVTERSAATAPLTPLRIVRALSALSPSQTRALEELERSDPDGQGRLQEALAAGGVERIAALVETRRRGLPRDPPRCGRLPDACSSQSPTCAVPRGLTSMQPSTLGSATGLASSFARAMWPQPKGMPLKQPSSRKPHERKHRTIRPSYYMRPESRRILRSRLSYWKKWSQSTMISERFAS